MPVSDTRWYSINISLMKDKSENNKKKRVAWTAKGLNIMTFSIQTLFTYQKHSKIWCGPCPQGAHSWEDE